MIKLDKRKDEISMLKNEKGQAVAPKTVTMTKKDFEDQGNTRVYWLGGGGAMINDHGTVIMIDPLICPY